MKLVLNSFFLYLFFFSFPVFGDSFFKTYVIKVSGIKIGKLDWETVINDKNYTNSIMLKSEGIFSSLYKFNGEYFSNGFVKNKTLKPVNYKHLWNTKKITKKMRLFFDNNKLESLEQEPTEGESLRINIYDIEDTKDPLTSFLQIIIGLNNPLVLDGRRLYNMNASYHKDSNQTIIQLENYLNLWADHKNSKFEKIVFEKNDDDFLPSKIIIYFDKKIFRVEQI